VKGVPEFAEWESFYVIVGAAAGALIGLQFVVLTLIAESPPPRAAEAGPAFVTPTIVHFSAVLLLSAGLRAPWHAVTSAAVFRGVVGLYGLAHSVVVARRMRAQGAYRPDAEDGVCFGFLPVVAYAMLPLSALAASSHAHEASFGAAAERR